MAVYKVAVILWKWGPPVPPHDRNWYEEYFFNQVFGQAGYWLKQSDGNVVLSGRVFGWLGGLAYYLEQGDRESFELAATTLRHHLRLPDAKLRLQHRNEVGDFPQFTEDGPVISPVSEFPGNRRLNRR